jgi:hypothetical protein
VTNARRLTLATLAWACATGALAFSSAPAQATVQHKYEAQIPGLAARALTVASGHLYDFHNIGETNAYAVDEYDPSTNALVSQLALPGALDLWEGLAFGGSTGETEMYLGAREEANPERAVVVVYGVSASGSLTGVSAQGTWTGADTPNGSFGDSKGERVGHVNHVAVDGSTSAKDWASGDVFVSTESEYLGRYPELNVVDVFKPEAGGNEKYVTQLTGISPSEPFQGPLIKAVSGFNGDLLIADRRDSGETVIDMLEPVGLGGYAFVGRIAPAGGGSFYQVNDVAVDGASGEIYVAGATGTEAHHEAGVYEFSPAGVSIGRITGEETPLGGFSSAEPVAIDPASHRVFVGDRRPGEGNSLVDEFGPDELVPDVRSEPVSSVRLEAESHRWSAELNGMVDPDGAGEASCAFAWGTSASFGESQPCTRTVPDGAAAEEVRAFLSGLEPDKTYHYRLQAGNANGTNRGEESQDQAFTTPGPGLLSESASEMSSSSVRLEATVDPHEARKTPTSYYFEYGPTAGYGSDAPVLGGEAPEGALVGSGAGGVEVHQHVLGLSAATAYHYRVVAVSEVEVSEGEGVFERVAFHGPDRTFVTQPPGGGLMLPDGRAWELVSPVDKHGAVITPISEAGVEQAAVNGRAFTYLTSLPTEAEPQGYGQEAQVLSSRTAAGWSSVDIALPHSAPVGALIGVGQEYRFFSEDLSQGIAESFGPFTPLASDRSAGEPAILEESPQGTERTPYLRSTCRASGLTCYEPLLTSAAGYEDVAPGVKFGGDPQAQTGPVVFKGATPDASHVVLSSPFALTSTAVPPNGVLYEWSATMPASKRLALVSVLPSGEGAVPVAGIFGGGGSAGARVARAISNDGSRIFFTAEFASETHLYMRDTTRGVEGESLRVDVVQGGSGQGPGRPVFQSASADGSKVFFTDEAALTEGSGAQSEAPDLYECEVVETGGQLGCIVSDLTPEPAGLPAGVHESAGVVGGVLGSSENGDTVYFVANGVLGDGGEHGASRGTCISEGGTLEGARCNLYVERDGVISFIASLSQADEPDWAVELRHSTARVSPDGGWLAFMSDSSLTGYDNRDAKSGVADEEVFLYDAEAKKLVCASCDPSGARPSGEEYESRGNLTGGNNVWVKGRWLAANVPAWTPFKVGPALYQSRYLFDDGRLFFNSSDALVPQDTNGNEDVYEYEPPGVGGVDGCSTGASTFSGVSGGCVALISSGVAHGESAFMDASESGGDVFFLTSEKLVSKDVDTAIDVYDAHECNGASPCVSGPAEAPPACVSTEACRVAPLAQPSIYGAPSSATFTGAGNVSPPVAAAVKVRALTRAQKLARALRVCAKDRVKRKRAVCERQAHKRYGPSKSSGASAGKSAGLGVRRRARG